MISQGILQETKMFLHSLDSRAVPRYSYAQAARYLRLPKSTLRAWFAGMTYGTRPNLKVFKPLLKSSSVKNQLSFYDIASAHILMAFKQKGASAEDIRAVVESLRKELPDAAYPLLGREFFMFGKDVVIDRLGQLMNLSKHRQLGLKKIMEKFLARVENDKDLMPVRFSPVHAPHARGKGIIIIDPDLSYGRPVIRGTGIAAEVIANRRQSGESISGLAKDYGLSRREIQEAISYFKKAA